MSFPRICKQYLIYEVAVSVVYTMHKWIKKQLLLIVYIENILLFVVYIKCI